MHLKWFTKFILVISTGLLAFTAEAQKDKSIAITIDDVIGVSLFREDSILREINKRVINACIKHGAPAIGFVNEIKLMDLNGNPVPEKLEILELWAKNGLELGNHTYSHLDYNDVDEETFFQDVLKGEQYTRPLMRRFNKNLTYFRHPFLHKGNTPEKVLALEAFLESRRYEEAPVTIDNSEYIFARAFDLAKKRDNHELADNIGRSYVSYMIEKLRYYEKQSEGLFNRQISQILLIHDNLLNAFFLDPLLEAISDEGYRFVFLSEALKDPAYDSEDKFVTRSGITWLHRWAITQGKPNKFFAGEPTCPRYVQEYAGIFE